MIALACVRPAAAEPFSLFPREDPAPAAGRLSFRAMFPAEPPMDSPASVEAAAEASLAAEDPVPDAAPLPAKTRATLVTAGVLIGTVASTLSGGWTRGYVPFHEGHEYWFGKNTYAGGADKASHFVLYNALARELHVAFGRMHYPDAQAYRMAFSTAVAAGLITELGDAIGHGSGFSYEDLIMDTLGAGTAVFVTEHGLDDVLGFRFGFVPAQRPTPCCPFHGPGKDYSDEIYTGDLKIAGVARRMRVDPGPARFLLLSATYGSKGYKYSLPEFRQQQIGIEVGLDFPEILTAAGVKDTTWWGRCLFLFFHFVRVPYTQIGCRYDFIHHRWHGPNIGQ